jgi:hypothetical protein
MPGSQAHIFMRTSGLGTCPHDMPGSQAPSEAPSFMRTSGLGKCPDAMPGFKAPSQAPVSMRTCGLGTWPDDMPGFKAPSEAPIFMRTASLRTTGSSKTCVLVSSSETRLEISSISQFCFQHVGADHDYVSIHANSLCSNHLPGPFALECHSHACKNAARARLVDKRTRTRQPPRRMGSGSCLGAPQGGRHARFKSD